MSYPFLHGIFVVVLRHSILLHTFVFKLKNRVHQDQDAERQDAGDHHSDGVYSCRDVIDGHHDVHVIERQLAVTTVTVATCAFHIGLIAAHPVTQDGFWVSRLHRQLLVVKLPVLLSFVEVGVV